MWTKLTPNLKWTRTSVIANCGMFTSRKHAARELTRAVLTQGRPHGPLFMVALWNREDHIYFHAVVCSFFFLLFSFLALSQRSEIGCLPYFHIWCGLSATANLGIRMQVWSVLHASRWKCRTQKNRQKVAIWAPSYNFVGLYLHN